MQAVKRPDQTQHLGIVASGRFRLANILDPDFPKQDVLKHLSDEKYYQPGQPSYAITKLFVQYFAAEIAKLVVSRDGRQVGNPSAPPITECGDNYAYI
jgi:hypothetical protein